MDSTCSMQEQTLVDSVVESVGEGNWHSYQRRYGEKVTDLLKQHSPTRDELVRLLSVRPSPSLDTLVALSQQKAFDAYCAAWLGRAWGCHGILISDGYHYSAPFRAVPLAYCAVALSEHWWFSDRNIPEVENALAYSALIQRLSDAGPRVVETALALLRDRKPASQVNGNDLVPGIIELACLLS